MKLLRLLESLGDIALHNADEPPRLVVGTRTFFALRDEIIRWAPRWAQPPIEAMELSFENVVVCRDTSAD